MPSIIEKAAGRLDKSKGTRLPSFGCHEAEPSVEPMSSRINGTERLQKRRSRRLSTGKKIEINLTRLNNMGFVAAGEGRSPPIAEDFQNNQAVP